uniref:Putative rna-directed dna polymerase from mobile element jockey-like protein n=1 Tax=Ixodes ricinus TaxID=34613 RepID=A0A6B0V5F1_IXORI
MLTHLHPSTLLLILYLFNRVWQEGRFPLAWKVTTVIPLLKPEKNASSASSYRPIALTSCLGKTSERLVNKRLMYFLEKQNILDKNQCGFRFCHSTVDHLVRLKTTIRQTFVNKQHCLSVFYDLEKAYDRAWRYGILRDLYEVGVRGRLLAIIKNYLSERTFFFFVKLGMAFSREFMQETGVPQGSVFSVTLFIIKINSIVRSIPPSVQYSLFVDDLQISVSSCNLSICERRLQVAINNLLK